jgi:hypothetical protein
MSTEAYTPIAKVSDKRGLALLEETIQEIEAHGFRTWFQGAWLDHVDHALWIQDMPRVVVETRVPTSDCGTTACLFGHVVFKAGARLTLDEYEDVPQFSYGRIERADGVGQEISVHARELLGLPVELAQWLSDADRTWEDILCFRDAWRVDAAAGPDVDAAREGLTYGSRPTW